MKTLLEKYDTTFSQLHGGGNGRRLVELFRKNIISQDQYDKRLVEQAQEIIKSRIENNFIQADNKIDYLLGYILALDEASAE